MFVDTATLERGREPGTLLAFFQAQRTGSTATKRWLQTRFARDDVYAHRNVAEFTHWNKLTPEALAPYEVFAGFSSFVDRTDLGRPFVAFAAVRHPMHRIASLYSMSRARPSHVYHELAHRATLEQYFREGYAERPSYFSNLCARRIGGAPTCDAALEAIHARYGAVTPTDRLHAFSRLLIDTYGWDVDPMPESAPDCERYAEVMRSPALEEILDANREDLALYEHITSLAAPAASKPATASTPGQRANRVPRRDAMTAPYSRTYEAAVDPAFGFSRVALTLTIPSVPRAAIGARFLEHAPGSSTVIAGMRGGVLVSDDLGDSWSHRRLPGAPERDYRNCLTTASGDHLLQLGTSDDETGAAVCRFDSEWNEVSVARPGAHPWHGSRSVAEADGTIMWAEYPDDSVRDPSSRRREGIDSHVFRSRDGGTTWETVFSRTRKQIRHFHTVVADPYVRGQWWLSSGDKPAKCRVWLSRDDGDSWEDVTDPEPRVLLHPAFQDSAQSVHRHTDIWIGEHELVWGADDWLGDPESFAEGDPADPRRIGSRVFRSVRTAPLQPRDAGWVGNPIRSMIDVGPALLVTTEAKRTVLSPAQVCLVSKAPDGPIAQIATVDTVDGASTGLTYSRASAVAQDGVFFSFRASRDLVASPTGILRWSVELG